MQYLKNMVIDSGRSTDVREGLCLKLKKKGNIELNLTAGLPAKKEHEPRGLPKWKLRNM